MAGFDWSRENIISYFANNPLSFIFLRDVLQRTPSLFNFDGMVKGHMA